MAGLEFEITERQLRRAWRSVIGAGLLWAMSIAILVQVLTGARRWADGLWPIEVALIVLTVYEFLVVRQLFAFRRAYTACSPAGIATRGLFGTGIWPWSEVRGITQTRRAGFWLSGAVVLVTNSGQRVRLGAPLRTVGGIPDENWAHKFEQLINYSQEMITPRD